MIELYNSVVMYINTGHITIFLIFSIFVWTIMIPRFITGLLFHAKLEKKQYDKYRDEKHPCTAIVPVFREGKDDFERCLTSLKSSLEHGASAHQIIVVIDGVEDRNINGYDSPEYELASQYADNIIFTNFRNKRENLVVALKLAKYELILTSDSDTFYDDKTVYELLRPFSDPKVGGASSCQRIYSPKNMLQRIADWLEHARILSSLPTMSLAGSVGCLPGRAIAYRKSILEKNQSKFINDFFLGAKAIVGDDRVVTNFILREGYKTIFASRAQVYTLAPKKLWVFIKQQLRWSRSSQKYTLISPWLFKHPATAAIFWTDLMLTIFTTFIICYWVYSTIFGMTAYSLVMGLVIAWTGMSLTMLIRQIFHLYQEPRDIILTPIFAIYATALQLIRFYGLLTMHRANVWGTRTNNKGEHKNKYIHPDELDYFLAK